MRGSFSTPLRIFRLFLIVQTRPKFVSLLDWFRRKIFLHNPRVGIPFVVELKFLHRHSSMGRGIIFSSMPLEPFFRYCLHQMTITGSLSSSIQRLFFFRRSLGLFLLFIFLLRFHMSSFKYIRDIAAAHPYLVILRSSILILVSSELKSTAQRTFLIQDDKHHHDAKMSRSLRDVSLARARQQVSESRVRSLHLNEIPRQRSKVVESFVFLTAKRCWNCTESG